MQTRPLAVLAALAAVTSPELLERGGLEKLKIDLRNRFAADPMGSILSTVAFGSYLFYRAEKGHNPKVNSYYDALIYVSTNLSVGYSDIFAKTPMGKAIGTVLMTYGPAMAARALDEPVDPKAMPDATNREVVERLDKILEALAGPRA